VSRETRRLLLAALVAVVVLWMLARVRFTQSDPPQSAVQPLLAQLAPRPAFGDLATDVARVRARIDSLFVLVDAPAPERRAATLSHHRVAALRITETLAVALLPNDAVDDVRDLDVVAVDAVTGLVLLNVEPGQTPVAPTPWNPQWPEEPQFLLETTTSSQGVWLRPVFVSGLEPENRPAWRGEVWNTTSATDLRPGSFAFTVSGELAGLVIGEDDDRSIVGTEVLAKVVAELRDQPARPPGFLNVEVQPLTPGVAAATGSSGGVVVTWVEGAPASGLVPGDVVEEIDGQRVTHESWMVRTRRIAEGQALQLRVRRAGELRDVTLIANAGHEPDAASALGLTLRPVPGIGSEVVHVGRMTAGERATIAPGDVITRVGDIDAPTPAQVRTLFARSGEGRAMLVAVTRGASHHVVVLER
jgi:hypothetical protein